MNQLLPHICAAYGVEFSSSLQEKNRQLVNIFSPEDRPTSEINLHIIHLLKKDIDFRFNEAINCLYNTRSLLLSTARNEEQNLYTGFHELPEMYKLEELVKVLLKIYNTVPQHSEATQNNSKRSNYIVESLNLTEIQRDYFLPSIFVSKFSENLRTIRYLRNNCLDILENISKNISPDFLLINSLSYPFKIVYDEHLFANFKANNLDAEACNLFARLEAQKQSSLATSYSSALDSMADKNTRVISTITADIPEFNPSVLLSADQLRQQNDLCDNAILTKIQVRSAATILKQVISNVTEQIQYMKQEFESEQKKHKESELANDTLEIAQSYKRSVHCANMHDHCVTIINNLRDAQKGIESFLQIHPKNSQTDLHQILTISSKIKSYSKNPREIFSEELKHAAYLLNTIAQPELLKKKNILIFQANSLNMQREVNALKKTLWHERKVSEDFVLLLGTAIYHIVYKFVSDYEIIDEHLARGITDAGILQCHQTAIIEPLVRLEHLVMEKLNWRFTELEEVDDQEMENSAVRFAP